MRNCPRLHHLTMADWSIFEHEWPPDLQYDPYFQGIVPSIQEKPQLSQCFATQAQSYFPPLSPTLTVLLSPQNLSTSQYAPVNNDLTVVPKGDSPREIRNKAEKQRRDKLNHSISKLASLVPPVVAANRKIDKTGVLRLTAHYLRAHQYVFGDSIQQPSEEPKLNATSVQALLGLLKGFLLTTTYKGLIVVVSQNIQHFLGYSELDLLGQNIFNIVHPDDQQIFKDNLMPESHLLGPNGELLIPDEPCGKQKIADALAQEKRHFVIRFKKLSQRSEPSEYVRCSVSGTLRKSDHACQGYNRCCQVVRRARARGDNPCSSGNDVVFIGIVRPISETYITERHLESFKMEYRTRHSIDGEIIQCEQRIALVTGYMTHEVNGVNAMNFMHRDDVRWVIIALREMYDQHRVVGESCYRLMTKNGQFIYMKTLGQLDIEDNSRAVRSFVCTNTVVEEEEGKQLIKLMKRKFMLMVNSDEETGKDEEDDEGERRLLDEPQLPVEDPRQLEKVILHLVTNLPSPQSHDHVECIRGPSPHQPLAIIPPKKERIVSAIEKIYSIIKSFPKNAEFDTAPREIVDAMSKKRPESPLAMEVTPYSSRTPAPPAEETRPKDKRKLFLPSRLRSHRNNFYDVPRKNNPTRIYCTCKLGRMVDSDFTVRGRRNPSSEVRDISLPGPSTSYNLIPPGQYDIPNFDIFSPGPSSSCISEPTNYNAAQVQPSTSFGVPQWGFQSDEASNEDAIPKKMNSSSHLDCSEQIEVEVETNDTKRFVDIVNSIGTSTAEVESLDPDLDNLMTYPFEGDDTLT